MRFLLDANIVVAASLGIGDALRERMAECAEGDLVTSAIAYAEVVYGSAQGKPPPITRLKSFLEEVPVLAFDPAAAEAYAQLRFKRASFDRLIAAHAIALGLTLVTKNTRDFADVPGLRVENWAMA
jgi:tRNA(fMet)-specific endonuclease VapC